MTATYYQDFDAEEKQICALLQATISAHLPAAENKIWHAHPVWFLDGNPIVGFSHLLPKQFPNRPRNARALSRKIRNYPVGLQKHCEEKRTAAAFVLDKRNE